VKYYLVLTFSLLNCSDEQQERNLKDLQIQALRNMLIMTNLY